MPNDNTRTGKQYAERDVLSLDEAGGYYFRHVSAMTSEGLHAKSDIAAELAWRDAEIDRLKRALSRTPAEPKAGDWEKAIRDLEHELCWCKRNQEGQRRGSHQEYFHRGTVRATEKALEIVRALSSAAPRITESQDDK